MEEQKDQKIKELEEKLKKFEKESGFFKSLLILITRFFRFLVLILTTFLNTIAFFRRILFNSENFGLRFLAFLALSEALFLFVSTILMGFSVYMTFGARIIIGSLVWLALIATNTCLILIFLFKKVHAKALNYFWSILTFFALAWMFYPHFIFTIFFPLDSIMYFVQRPLHLNSVGMWQFINGIIILTIGVARTFILGLLKDYQNLPGSAKSAN
jgi:hypothetical protein